MTCTCVTETLIDLMGDPTEVVSEVCDECREAE